MEHQKVFGLHGNKKHQGRLHRPDKKRGMWFKLKQNIKQILFRGCICRVNYLAIELPRIPACYPKRSNAVGHCSNAIHHGFLSKKMIKEHECKKKNCRFFKTIEQFELDEFRKKKEKCVNIFLKRLLHIFCRHHKNESFDLG